MAEMIGSPIGPLDAWAVRFTGLAPAVSLASEPMPQVVVRTDNAGVIEALDLPSACRIRRYRNETAIWLGPDEWLLTHEGMAPHEWVAEVEGRVSIRGSFVAATRPTNGAYVLDASGQRTRLVLGGPHATAILRHGCAIDLSPEAFGDNDVAQTLLAQAGVIVHREHDRNGTGDGFVLYVRSSFAEYLAEWIVDAATEYLLPHPTS
ncbi:sarcosine oxidase subunit gamma family protein [Gordonia sp. PKS22-38]|uniref:Sarcosine oxidase subunit gamma family protein n=1 Tax=Gordonia prachuapensis TaxID=3115651 RepID=A0ABU7MZ19_9ACTN|nr:sarcosine oxidase subunit gamma family protein [Gordonia sp. PKS22-38]